MRFSAAAFLLLLAPVAAAAVEAPSIKFAVEDSEHWRAEYSLQKPALSLTLTRDIAGARQKTWLTADDKFEIVKAGETEVIRRKDGRSFTSVSVIAPTVYVTPQKGYLTFATFSDGGLLLYTGNFHACAGECPITDDGNDGKWRITAAPGGETRMIVDGEVQRGAATFLDSSAGTKIYIGDGDIIEGPSLLAVVDPGLPAPIKIKLDALFPRLMTYFGDALGPLDEKQMLFISWDVPGTELGAQAKGGTLPGQVFIHFEGAKIPEMIADEDYPFTLSWFFAHEAGHLHQHYDGAKIDDGSTWIHEGGADALAYQAMKDLGAAPEDYLSQRLTNAAAGCATGLADGPMRDFAESGHFQAYYDCGMLMHLAAAKSANASMFELWKMFLSSVEDGAPWTSTTFLEVVSSSGGGDAAEFIETLSAQDIEAPERYLAKKLALLLPEALANDPFAERP